MLHALQVYLIHIFVDEKQTIFYNNSPIKLSFKEGGKNTMRNVNLHKKEREGEKMLA